MSYRRLDVAVRLRRTLGTAKSVLTRVLGVPDYDTYLRHVATAHPGTSPVPRDQFIRERLDMRYSRPGARCC